MVNGKHLENFFKIETFSMVILTYQPIAREAKNTRVKPLTSTMIGMIWGWATTYGIRWK